MLVIPLQQFTTAAQQSPNVSEETRELLARIAELQQEKWSLEERVGRHCCRVMSLPSNRLKCSELLFALLTTPLVLLVCACR